MTEPIRLSKSRFTSGVQCHKKLWWEIHEPGAPELQPDKVLRDLFDQGHQVGALARTRFPGGVLIDRSEEHTSELQSHVNLVCRLLLEKKNGVKDDHLPAESLWWRCKSMCCQWSSFSQCVLFFHVA